MEKIHLNRSTELTTKFPPFPACRQAGKGGNIIEKQKMSRLVRQDAKPVFIYIGK